ncbi:RNA methyltransferase [Paralimibaculum aggregatum]|uniref:RNA methyltransferase n=1 Tax=Paralimibaculum aggregatum TaxID=3036245 RepID=A0ABQ6LLJ4_9RHOB|nr:class I SAM-dependent RNA methyltransferase [Limibaculum sp. NKW23]GMG81291.1 RNA methyltransferase [Limibaculum sp. NKW23]
MTDTSGLFLACPPGLEPWLAAEAAALGLAGVRAVPGGVEAAGGLAEAMRANLWLRGATRVLLRIAEFRAMHLAQLDKRARKIPWGEILRRDVPVSVEAACRKSRIYHAGAAAERVARAIQEGTGAPAKTGRGRNGIGVFLRIDDDLATLSIDTSGEPLHKRGHKLAVARAPMRESMAALFLAACGYRPGEALLDPMCGSGTFPIEAAEISAGLAPGRGRSFAFERLAAADPALWAEMRGAAGVPEGPALAFGSDRDAGAVSMARENAGRAGVAALTAFAERPVSEIAPPEGAAPGLVMVNPPYGARVGAVKALGPLHAALGRVLTERFAGWRVGLVTTEAGLARATGLRLAEPGPPVPHGGLRVRLWQAGPL